LSTFFFRLREERDRIGKSQAEFASLGGVQRRAQINYEAGERFPDVAYLAALAAHGVDVRYVITGERDRAGARELSADEERVLALFRLAPAPVRQAVLAALAVGEAPAPAPAVRRVSGGQIVVHPGGSVGHVVDASKSQGGIRLGDVHMGVPAKKKGK
jgi:transcriptional regulator with XRE-family HTH domain